MKKILIAVPLLGIAVILVLGFYLDAIVQKGVETAGSVVTGVPVRLKEVNMSLMSGRGQLKGLFVGNPEGFRTKSAFRLHEVRIVLDVNSLFSEEVIIEEIFIQAPDITYEKSGRSDNIRTILHNVESLAGGVKRVIPQKKGRKAGGAETRVRIDHFIVKGGKIHVSATAFRGAALTYPMDDIHMKDIGRSRGGISLSKALQQIFAVVSQNIVTAVAGPTAGTLRGVLKR